jgi:pantoate--beta-alanine ligase
VPAGSTVVPVDILTSRQQLDQFLSRHGTGCTLVPTMGALHAGHAHLVEQARLLADTSPGPRPPRVLITIFVNPTQFNDPKDLERYPRTLNADAELCAAAGADAIFAPTVADMYPADEPVPVPPLPSVATSPGLEDAHRPGHFAGVCQVVQRLFDLCKPAASLFGEKDWQQLAVIRAMVQASGSPIRVIPVPTVREPDGLAMSSRNRFLSDAERLKATSLHAALTAAAEIPDSTNAERAMQAILNSTGLAIEYATIRHAETLMPVLPGAARHAAGRALIAARLGSVRLIDNAPWPGRPQSH